MKILALDLGVKTGWALGVVAGGSALPVSGTEILRTASEEADVGPAALADWLNKQWLDKKGNWRKDRPDLVVKEQVMPFGRMLRGASSAKVMTSQIELHAAVKIVCRLSSTKYIDVARPTILKHFVGTAKLDRKDGKLAVIKQAKLLKYIPLSCDDEDRADAVALWDFAARTFARISPGELRLFGEAA